MSFILRLLHFQKYVLNTFSEASTIGIRVEADERDQSSKHATLDSEHFRLARVRRSFSPGICSSIKRDVVVEVVDVALVVGGL